MYDMLVSLFRKIELYPLLIKSTQGRREVKFPLSYNWMVQPYDQSYEL